MVGLSARILLECVVICLADGTIGFQFLGVVARCELVGGSLFGRYFMGRCT